MLRRVLAVCVSLNVSSMAGIVQAEEAWGDALAKAVDDGNVSVDLRYRFEGVDQDGFEDEAKASTLRSRITLASGAIGGFSALVEADNVTSIGVSDYNSTENGETEYPVVADPEGTEINQVWLAYTADGLSTHAGRQRIVQGNQRFVGGVAWRQNEQTYDGLRVQWSPRQKLNVDLSYIYNVNRIFGPNDGASPADWEGDNVLLRASYGVAKGHTITGFGYWLDIEEQRRYVAGKTVDNATDTYGIEYDGEFEMLLLHAAYARQSEAGDSSLDYEADYYNLEVGAKVESFAVKAGYEVLAADNGVGFKTPLATLHKFQGWADKFLATPGDGIEDIYLSATGSFGAVTAMAVYHDFQAESSNADSGTEIDLSATWKVNQQFTVQAKYAAFATDDAERFADTDKLWLTLQLKLQ